MNLQSGNFEFKIRDFGIGIFKNVKDSFHLENEYQGAEHVLKGKQTTLPERHFGQGIFFTSRIADHYVQIENKMDDAYFADAPYLNGTQVEFSIKQKTKKILKTLFDRFTSDKDTFDFDKNILRVRLRANQELVSRSEARRLLMGLEDYKVIIFDFKGMLGIGQAFADEIFRVYTNQHPEKNVSYENAGLAVEFMIQRAKAEGK